MAMQPFRTLAASLDHAVNPRAGLEIPRLHETLDLAITGRLGRITAALGVEEGKATS